MRGAFRRHQREEEEESVFVSMTDMTVSFLFVVMILLAFFASQFNPKASAPKAQYDHVVQERDDLGACPNSRCSILSESDSTLGYEQVFSPLEYRSDAAAAAECGGLCAERPCLAVYRWAGAGEPRSQGDHGQLCERARAATV